MTLFSASILLFLVMDPFGNAPLFLFALKGVAPERRSRIVVRESLIALLVLLVFFFAGPPVLKALRISQPALHISGGIVLLLVAVKMIFGSPEELLRGTPEGEPFIVPLAIPSVAGPSAVAVVMILRAQHPAQWPEWLLALFLAWVATGTLLLLSERLARFLGNRGITGLQRLMGLLLTTIAVEMFIEGWKRLGV